MFAVLEKHRIPIEPLLRKLLERVVWDGDFRRDLDLCGFQPEPCPSDEIDCLNPWLFVIAMDGSGSAYGLCVHPDAIRDGVAPWAYWEHEDQTIVFLADDTDSFLRGFLTEVASWIDEPERLARVAAVFAELGVQVDGARVAFDFEADGPKAPWLPPQRDVLEDVTTYVAMLQGEPSTAERGLLGHVQYDDDPDARDALEQLYSARAIVPPRTHDD